jgi:hypothetical protein
MSPLPGLTGWMIHAAARRAPHSLSARLEEEWLADSASRSAGWPCLCFAIGCWWAAWVISREAGPHTRWVIPVRDRSLSYVCLRSGTLFLILGMHAALFCGLMTTI